MFNENENESEINENEDNQIYLNEINEKEE
jgi:hypothetical protein